MWRAVSVDAGFLAPCAARKVLEGRRVACSKEGDAKGKSRKLLLLISNGYQLVLSGRFAWIEDFSERPAQYG